MAHESVVYGCITDMVFVDEVIDIGRRRQFNREATHTLPSGEDWPLWCREMFSSPQRALDLGDCQTNC